MKPVLFAANANNFTSNGIGVLSDAISCTVTEERNGTFELSMTYPVTGEHYAEIMPSAIIRAMSTPGGDPQLFRVYSITKPINGVVTIDAEHISYQLSYIPAAPFTAGSVGAALVGLKNHAMTDCPFTFWTDKTTVANYKQTAPENIRARLGGVSGSILDVYGGEYEFDNYTVKLHNNRGTDRGVTLRYGKNITDIEQEENIAATYTSIVGTWQSEDVEVHTAVIDSDKAGSFPYKRVKVVDFSSEYEEQPTVATLTSRATSYMNANDFGVPKISIKVSFVALWQTDEYKDIAPLERVYLCDTVTVQFEKLGISTTAKVVKTVYNALLDRYDSIEIGEAKTNLSNRIAGQGEELRAAINDTATELERAQNRLTQKITGAKGGWLVDLFNADDERTGLAILGDKNDLDTAQKVWLWNAGALAYSKTGINGPFTVGINSDGEIVADFITTGTMYANRVRGGLLESSDANHNLSFDLSTGDLAAKRLTITSPNFTLDANGNIAASNASFADTTMTNATINGGSINYTNKRFSVDADGNMSAQNATLTGATINGGSINYTNGRFNVDENGNLTAQGAVLTNATISGKLKTSELEVNGVPAVSGETTWLRTSDGGVIALNFNSGFFTGKTDHTDGGGYTGTVIKSIWSAHTITIKNVDYDIDGNSDYGDVWFETVSWDSVYVDQGSVRE